MKAYAESGAVMTFGVTGTPLGTVLNVGGGATQLPPGRWQFAVLASNAVSQVRSRRPHLANICGASFHVGWKKRQTELPCRHSLYSWLLPAPSFAG